MVNFIAARVPELRAAASCYGGPPPLDQVGRIKGELVSPSPTTTSASTPRGPPTRPR
jgi:hypothetical protein